MGYKGSQGAIRKIMKKVIFSYKMHILIKRLFFELDLFEVQVLVLKCFLSASTHPSPPLQDLFDTLNHLILVTNEGIKRKIWLSMTLGSTSSWKV